MTTHSGTRFAGIVALAGALAALTAAVHASSGRSGHDLPDRILWAWERPEDLRGESGIGVAFLASTVRLIGEKTRLVVRRQPLRVKPGTPIVAVVRVETRRPALDRSQREDAVRAILAAARLPGVRALQIDFDAAVSERGFYRRVLVDTRASLPRTMPLSMTALASWCLYDGWIEGLPVDEAVPMLFDMGPDASAVQKHLRDGKDFLLPVCRGSYGVSVAEPVEGLRPGRRVYWWSPAAWTEKTRESTRRTR